MAKIEKLTNIDGTTIYPKTLASAVIYDDNKSVSTMITNGVYANGSDAISVEEKRIPVDADTLQGHSSEYFVNNVQLNETKEFLNNRIDNIVTSGDGSGSNSELIDIRTGHDGTVYSSAGAAVREQIGELKRTLENFENQSGLLPIVSVVEEMMDITKKYVLKSTGTIWQYRKEMVTQKVTEQIVGTADNPYSVGRLSNGDPNGLSGYFTTPYIDLQKYSVPFTLYLKGAPFSYTTPLNTSSASYLRHSQYDTSKVHLHTELTQMGAFVTFWSGAVMTDVGDGSVEIAFTPPVTNKSVNVGYVRFSGYGTEADANVYIEYETEVEIEMWHDTGVEYNNDSDEDYVNIKQFTLANPSVEAFMDTVEYNPTDYSYTNVAEYSRSDYYRKDLPFPIILGWNKNANAVQYTVSINTVRNVLTTGMQIYYTQENSLSVWNLIPDKIYYYKVYALCADGTTELIKDDSFTTSAGCTRMLNIEGIQNVRDIGGYMAGVGTSAMVKYGLIYRGSAMDEKTSDRLRITDKGRQDMLLRVGIKTDLDLRGHNNVSEGALGDDIDFYTPQYSYLSYTNAITDATAKSCFKTMLEYIVTQLTANKPVYIHCSGGCDRTGTLVFLLLGLLGVSESDLAKEYELSAFSPIGNGRYRNSTSYNYSGMVEAIKAYGSTDTNLVDKFVAFATECGISDETITSFRNLMLV